MGGITERLKMTEWLLVARRPAQLVVNVPASTATGVRPGRGPRCAFYARWGGDRPVASERA